MQSSMSVSRPSDRLAWLWLALNKRLESIGWALFLIMIGGLGLVPKGVVPGGIWLIGADILLKPFIEKRQE